MEILNSDFLTLLQTVGCNRNNRMCQSRSQSPGQWPCNEWQSNFNLVGLGSLGKGKICLLLAGDYCPSPAIGRPVHLEVVLSAHLED